MADTQGLLLVHPGVFSLVNLGFNCGYFPRLLSSKTILSLSSLLCFDQSQEIRKRVQGIVSR